MSGMVGIAGKRARRGCGAPGRHLRPPRLSSPPLRPLTARACGAAFLGGMLLLGGAAQATSPPAGGTPEDGVPDAPAQESPAPKPPPPPPLPPPQRDKPPANKAPPANKPPASKPPANKPPPAPARPGRDGPPPSGFEKDFPLWGVRDAAVRVVIFSDFECPYCARTAKAMAQVMKRYPKDVQIEFLNLPLPQHASARSAAIAGLAAHRQGAFFRMHDKLFDGDNDLDHGSYLRMARELSLDVARFERDLKDPALARMVDRDMAIARAVGADGTPTLFINGRGIFGAKPFELLRVHIDSEIAAAKKAGERGRAWLLKRARLRNRKLLALVY